MGILGGCTLAGSNFIFLSWFTFGDGAVSGQRWLTAQGDFEGSTALIDVYETTGGSFDAARPPVTVKAGTLSLDFTDCSHALLGYSLPDDEGDGEIAVMRLLPGTQAVCENL